MLCFNCLPEKMFFRQNQIVCLLFYKENDLIFNFKLSLHIQANALVWPKPKYMEQYKLSNYQVIDPTNFEIILQGNSAKCDILIEAVKRYKKKLFADDCSLFDHKRNHHKTIYPNNSADDSYEGDLTRLVINNLDNCPKYPSEDMLESYHLKTNTVGEASLRAEQVWGILTGLETFSQLVFWNGQFFGVNMTLIKDSPRFNLRGIMLDTSRHFLPVHILQQNLDAMEGNKMNVFHWHIVDDQSFPYVSTKFPQMSKKGAFSDKHVYSQEDIKSIIDYARLRGIRVIVEFDTPGHSLSWGKGIKDLLTPCYDSRRQLNGQFGPIDPSVKKNYKFMGDLLKEIGQVFPDNYLHLGGDEVDFSCWKSNPNITQFMKRYKLPDYESLEGFFIKLIAKYAAKMGKTNIFWQEVFENKVQVDLKNSIIHVWKDWGNYKLAMDNITKAGYKVILSSPWWVIIN